MVSSLVALSLSNLGLLESLKKTSTVAPTSSIPNDPQLTSLLNGDTA
jgi:hypothetical protein